MLIGFAYPNLRMLRSAYDEATLSQTLLDPDDLLAGGQPTLSEAEQEVLTYVMRNQHNGERTSVQEIVRQFGRRPHGWYSLAVLTLIARLFRLGKVELRAGDLLDARAALEALKNPRQHGGIQVRLQEQFDPAQVAALKRFHQDFFDRVNEATDPRSVAQLTSEALAGEARDLQVLLDQSGVYGFLRQLQAPAARIPGDQREGLCLSARSSDRVRGTSCWIPRTICSRRSRRSCTARSGGPMTRRWRFTGGSRQFWRDRGGGTGTVAPAGRVGDAVSRCGLAQRQGGHDAIARVD